MFQLYKVEVKEPPQGMTPPTQSVVKKAPHQPSRLRKFVAKNSAGLRIRAHPSLQSEQIGIVHVNGTIAFIDEVSGHKFICFMLVIWLQKLRKTRTSPYKFRVSTISNKAPHAWTEWQRAIAKCLNMWQQYKTVAICMTIWITWHFINYKKRCTVVHNFALTLPDDVRIICHKM